MLKAAIISLGSLSSEWTVEEMKKLFDKVDAINLKDIEINLGSKEAKVLYKGKPLEDYDCVYAKGSFRYVPLLSSITTLLSPKSYMPIETRAFTTVNDK